MYTEYLIKLACGILLLGSPVSAADKDLLDLVTIALGEEDLASRLVEAGDLRDNAKGRFPMEGFDAFGLQFHGAVSRGEHDPLTISVSCAEPMLSPADAARVSAKIEDAISLQLGEGRQVNNIPNHEDATDVKSRGRLWAGPEGSVILLKTDDYFRVAQFSVVRYFDSFPLAETGKAKGFWLDHLKAILPPEEEPDADLAWAAEHSAGVVIDQLRDRNATYQGSLTYQGHRLPLEGGPPFFTHELKVGNVPVLLGDYYHRHRFIRSLCALRSRGQELKREYEISVDSPKIAGSGGFVFIVDRDSISRFGVIVPVVAKVPVGEDPRAYQWITLLRLHQQGRLEKDFSPDEILAIPIQDILPEWKLLMDTGSAPAKARIIWYKVEPSGDFSREG